MNWTFTQNNNEPNMKIKIKRFYRFRLLVFVELLGCLVSCRHRQTVVVIQTKNETKLVSNECATTKFIEQDLSLSCISVQGACRSTVDSPIYMYQKQQIE